MHESFWSAKFNGKIDLSNNVAEDLVLQRLFYFSSLVQSKNGNIYLGTNNPSRLKLTDDWWDAWVKEYLQPQITKYTAKIDGLKHVDVEKFIDICQTQEKRDLNDLLGKNIYLSGL